MIFANSYRVFKFESELYIASLDHFKKLKFSSNAQARALVLGTYVLKTRDQTCLVIYVYYEYCAINL